MNSLSALPADHQTSLFFKLRICRHKKATENIVNISCSYSFSGVLPTSGYSRLISPKNMSVGYLDIRLKGEESKTINSDGFSTCV